MAYKAIVSKLNNVRKHPNADRLQLATVQGYQIIIGLGHKEGELGVFYNCDGSLSEEHLMANELYRKNPKTGEKMKGFFDNNGRVRALKLRDEISEGYWEPISNLSWTGEDLSKLKEGKEFNKLNDKTICAKYYTRATKEAMEKRKKKKLRRYYESKMFHKHFDTGHLLKQIRKIPDNAVIYIMEKEHGTSGRTGHLRMKTPGYIQMPGIELEKRDIPFKIQKATGPYTKIVKKNSKYRILKKYFHLYVNPEEIVPERILKAHKRVSKAIKNIGSKYKWQYISGTRKTVLDPNEVIKDRYYKGDTFRNDIHEMFKKIGLKKGETIYYEIVGYRNDGSPLQWHKVSPDKGADKKLKKEIMAMQEKFGMKMPYSYGCDPSAEKKFDIHVYRITLTNEDGDSVDLSWPQVVARCSELGIKTVKLVVPLFIFDDLLATIDSPNDDDDRTNYEILANFCKRLADEPSLYGDEHIREGIAVRIEHEKMFTILKHKGFWFNLFEGQMKNSEDFVDEEEIN